MTKALRATFQGFNVLFLLNRDFLLSVAITALALAGGALLATL